MRKEAKQHLSRSGLRLGAAFNLAGFNSPAFNLPAFYWLAFNSRSFKKNYEDWVALWAVSHFPTTKNQIFYQTLKSKAFLAFQASRGRLWQTSFHTTQRRRRRRDSGFASQRSAPQILRSAPQITPGIIAQSWSGLLRIIVGAKASSHS